MQVYFFVLLPVHGCPGKLWWLQPVVEVPFAFWVGKQEDLTEHTTDYLQDKIQSLRNKTI